MRRRLPRAGRPVAILAIVGACLGCCAAPAMARELQIPTFLSPVRSSDLSPAAAPGGRPYELLVRFALNQVPGVEGVPGSSAIPAGDLRDLGLELPPGLVAGAASFPRCGQADFAAAACPTVSQVGIADPSLVGGGGVTVPVFNLVPPAGEPARFGLRLGGRPVDVDLQIRDGGDYGLTASVHGLDRGLGVLGASVAIWGVPADPRHDGLRFDGAGVPTPGPYPEPFPYRPLLSDPTSCDGPLVAQLAASTWQRPEAITSAAAFEAPPMGSCDQLEFGPRLSVRPTTTLGDSPTGLEVDLQVPQNQDAEGSAVAHLRSARIVLPAGLAIDPSAANGLGTCGPEQIGYLGRSSERQILRYELPPAGLSGSFRVSYGGQATAPILATADRAAVTAALEALPGLAGNVSLSGGPGGWIVAFTGALEGADVAQLSGSVADGPGVLVAVTGESGSFEMRSGGEGTGPLPFDIGAAALQAALREVPSLGRGNLFPGNVFVSGGGLELGTRTYLVNFAGDLTGTQPALTATSSLGGPGAGVAIKAAAPPAVRGLSVATLGGDAPGTPRFDGAPASCPDAAKIATARVVSPAVLDHPLLGGVYLASPGRNPFGSPLAIYLVLEDPATGLVVKLPGRVDADPQTGRLTATIAEAPQLPFEGLRLEFFKGAGAPLRTPVACGAYGVESALTAWGAPETATARPRDSFAISAAAGGTACTATPPDLTSFEAGTVEPTAGAYTPFVLKLSRPDGSRPLGGVDTTLPEGLLARLAGTTGCPDAALAAAASRPGTAEQAAPSCPPASRIGSVQVAAGAGPTPYNLSGSAYLAGPYKGAPFSLAAVVPATAGPFDLGTVVTRSALYVDPETTRVRVVSDPPPTILGGIPLDLRSVRMLLDAPGFARNPTSCDPLAFTGPQAIRFQVGECARLAFAPALRLAAKGPSRRGGYPALRASIAFKGKREGADLAAVSLKLPAGLAFDRSRMKARCAAALFAAGTCPAASAVGSAKAVTPLLGEALEGPVYLRRSTDPAQKLPELVADLKGRVEVVLAGKLSIARSGGLVVDFDKVPDAPFSRFTLSLLGGKRGLLRNKDDLCARPLRAKASIDGQNAKAADQRPAVRAACGKGKKGRGGRR